MDPLMIYILDEKLPSSLSKEQLAMTQPLTKEEVVDLIISKINGLDEIEYSAFKQKYENLGFRYKSNENQYEIYLNDLESLEKLNQFRGTWNDPKGLKSDLLLALTSFHIVDEKTVLYHRQIQDWLKTAAGWLLLCKKREYFDLALKSLQCSITGKIDPSIQISVPTLDVPKQNIGNAPDKEPTNKVKEKKVSEKWYALLHMIYVNMDKYKPFEDFSNKKIIVTYGIENYPLKGKGQMFYKTISQINDAKSIYNYIHKWLTKDFWKWKRIITEISENDPAIKLWIDRNKM